MTECSWCQKNVPLFQARGQFAYCFCDTLVRHIFPDAERRREVTRSTGHRFPHLIRFREIYTFIFSQGDLNEKERWEKLESRLISEACDSVIQIDNYISDLKHEKIVGCPFPDPLSKSELEHIFDRDDVCGDLGKILISIYLSLSKKSWDNILYEL